MRKRVLLAGLFHETHTFLDGRTSLGDFTLRRGEELYDARGDGSPLCGALDVADACRWELLPAIDARATPSAAVEDDVLETWWDAVRQRIEAERAAGIDGVFLVLHGAMACISHPDVETEVLRRIRSLFDDVPNLPICAVFDLHGNIAPETAALLQGLVAYRCNPHTDSRDAAVRAARLLDRMLTTGERPVCVYEQPAVMWPPTGTGTGDEPMRSLESFAREIETRRPEIAAANVFAGFSFADSRHTGVSFSATTFGDPHAARRELRRLSEWTVAHREAGVAVDPPLESQMPDVLAAVARNEGPVLIVEPADNVGGGAPGDGATVLRALIEAGVDRAAVVLNDPAAVRRLQSAAIGSRVSVSLGGKGSRLTDGPLELDVELLSLSDGRFELEDRHSHLASMTGVRVDMGPCAVVRCSGVRVLVTSRKTPPFDLGQLRSQGISPEGCSVIGVKAAVAHRRAYDPIAARSFTVSTPGPCSSDLTAFPWRRLRRPIYPLDE